MDTRDKSPDPEHYVSGAQGLAERAAAAMYARDAASKSLGMVLESVAPGQSVMSMRIRRDMLNGYQTCQGGLIFALADSAFAFACNSRNDARVAAGGEIDFLQPGREDDVLRAKALERSLRGRTGVYDVTVTNQNDEMVALFRGRSYRVQGTVIRGSGA